MAHLRHVLDLFALIRRAIALLVDGAIAVLSNHQLDDLSPWGFNRQPGLST